MVVMGLEIFAILLVGMSIASTFATVVLVGLWRADRKYRADGRGWLARTVAIGSIMTLIPCWYFAGTLLLRISQGGAPLPEWFLPISATMVVLALGSPVYLALKVLTVRHGSEVEPWDHVDS